VLEVMSVGRANGDDEEMTMVPRRLVVVDDHEVVREGLVAVLGQEPGIEIVGTASTGGEAVDLARRVRPDVAIIDLRLPDVPGHELCRELVAMLPAIAVIVLTSALTEESVRDAIGAGAAAYVTKAAGIAELRAALARTVPGAPVPVLTVSQIVGRLTQSVDERTDGDAPTPQQARVLQLAAEGLTYREIAKRLVLSEATVRFHIQNLKIKYRAGGKTDLVVRAIQAGHVTPAGHDDQH
jgi:DNA-binding NarL/FixJ family response regulator